MTDQFSLFDSRPLFEDETLRRAQEGWDRSAIADFDRKSLLAQQFIQQVQLRAARALKEEALEQQFNRAFFLDLLGYEAFPGASGSWTAWPKPSTRDTRLTGEPDLLLGRFSNQIFEPIAVVELKRPSVPLDTPQGSYGGKTPVEQAFGYARKLGTCRWVCVSNMRFLRLYSVESSSSYFELDLWTQRQTRPQLKDLWHLLSFENLVEHDDGPTWRLLVSSQGRQVDFQEGFYSIYGEIRKDILEILRGERPGASRSDLVQATQRLLDRLMFIYFCEDHPDRLLRRNLVRDVVESAVRLPGSSRTKAYDALKALFNDLDVGANTEFWKIPRYNGELFKAHEILDSVNLPDALHAKRYTWSSPDGATRRTVQGAYGLHIFDFWKELDRDLLGNVFERSIGDLSVLTEGGVPNIRQSFGIYYTASRLARFAARSAVEASLTEDAELQEILGQRVAGDLQAHADQVGLITSRLRSYKIADIACGSGVFLSAAFDALLVPFRKALEAGSGGTLSREALSFQQSEMLKSSIFGCDILPQAVELAKLSLWLAAARRNEPSADLSSNFGTGDSLFSPVAHELASSAGGGFSIIVGNPPWGAEVLEDSQLDSWELFLRKCSELLLPGGRLALILPDTIFFSAKTSTRRWLLEEFEIEKVYALGADWFTNKVRMGTVFLQAKKSLPTRNHLITTLVVSGPERLLAQRGLRPIEQAEAVGSASLRQSRSSASDDAALEVLLGEEERPLIERIRASSATLSSITSHGRGDEMSSTGLFWRCGNCNALAVPGTKRKGGGFNRKTCPACRASLTEENVDLERLVSNSAYGPYSTPYVDGDTLTRRYQNPVRKYIRTDLKTFPALKASALYDGPRILIRQAGVGIAATLIKDRSRVPQSVYLYWALPDMEAKGYTNEFILAALVSRVMNYFHMKTTGEIDPARAFAKVTHDRLGSFPVPTLDTPEKVLVAEEISTRVNAMLTAAAYGGEDDWRIEALLRQLWGITGDEGRYINGFFSLIPDGQARRDLFPAGPPARIPYPVD